MFLFAGVSFAWMLLGFFALEEDEPSAEEDKRVDWIGAVLITVGLVLIVFVLSDLPTAPYSWKTPCKSTSAFFSKFILN
jgi:formate/nitrite transporter FocA (FNT family)